MPQTSVVTFIVYALLGNKITPPVAFTVVSLFQIIRNPFGELWGLNIIFLILWFCQNPKSNPNFLPQLSTQLRYLNCQVVLAAAGNFRPKFRFFVFSGKKLVTTLSRRSRLSQLTSGPTQLIRLRPIDCDKVPEQAVKNFLVFAHLFSSTAKKRFFKKYQIH